MNTLALEIGGSSSVGFNLFKPTNHNVVDLEWSTSGSELPEQKDKAFDSSDILFYRNNKSTYKQLANIAWESAIDDWDGDGAKAVDAILIPKVFRLLSKAPFTRLPQPDISAEPDGELNVGWFGEKGSSFSFSVNREGRIAYAMYMPEGMKFCGTGKVSDDLAAFEKFIQMASNG